jgi:hypothetical protein
LDFLITQAGTLQHILVWGQNDGEGIPGLGLGFHGYVLRPMSSNTYEVMMETGLLSVTNAGTNVFAAPPFNLQVGDLICHYGNGRPLSTYTGGPSSL